MAMTPLTKRFLIVAVAVVITLAVVLQVQRTAYRAGVTDMAETLAYMRYEADQSGTLVSQRELFVAARERLLK